MTQPTLTTLAQLGAPCKPWAEWCRNVLATTAWKKINDGSADEWLPEETREWKRGFLDSAKDSSDHKITIHGPLPSCTYLDDQLGEFLRLADIDHMHEPNSYSCLVFWGGPKVEEVCKCGNPPTLLDQLEAAVILVERAHRIGKYAHYTETESAPYLAAFLRGIGG